MSAIPLYQGAVSTSAAPTRFLAPASTLAPTLAVALGAAFLGVGPILVRFSGFGPQAAAFWRFAFALAPLAALTLALDRGKAIPNAPDLRALAIAGGLFALDIALWHAALLYTTVANATLLSNMAPVIAGAAGWLLFREKLRASYLLGASLAICGAALLAFGRSGGGASGLTGDALALGAALWYAIYLLMMRALRQRTSAWTAMLITTAAAAVVAAAASGVMHDPLFPADIGVRGWTMAVALGFLVHAGGQGLIAWGLGRLPLQRSTILLFIQPVAAAALGWAMLGQALGVAALAGAALILVGVFLVQQARR